MNTPTALFVSDGDHLRPSALTRRLWDEHGPIGRSVQSLLIDK